MIADSYSSGGDYTDQACCRPAQQSYGVGLSGGKVDGAVCVAGGKLAVIFPADCLFRLPTSQRSALPALIGPSGVSPPSSLSSRQACSQTSPTTCKPSRCGLLVSSCRLRHTSHFCQDHCLTCGCTQGMLPDAIFSELSLQVLSALVSDWHYCHCKKAKHSDGLRHQLPSELQHDTSTAPGGWQRQTGSQSSASKPYMQAKIL